MGCVLRESRAAPSPGCHPGMGEGSGNHHVRCPPPPASRGWPSCQQGL